MLREGGEGGQLSWGEDSWGVKVKGKNGSGSERS